MHKTASDIGHIINGPSVKDLHDSLRHEIRVDFTILVFDGTRECKVLIDSIKRIERFNSDDWCIGFFFTFGSWTRKESEWFYWEGQYSTKFRKGTIQKELVASICFISFYNPKEGEGKGALISYYTPRGIYLGRLTFINNKEKWQVKEKATGVTFSQEFDDAAIALANKKYPQG